MSYRSMVRQLLMSAVATATLGGAAWAQIVAPQFIGPLTPAENRGLQPSWTTIAAPQFIGPATATGNCSSQAWWAPLTAPQFIGPPAPSTNFGSQASSVPVASTQAYGIYMGPIPPAKPMTPGSGAPFYASQLRSGYGVTSLAASGAGQTIAIVDAYDYPNALSTLNTYSTTMGLPQMTSTSFMQLNQSGGTALPGTDPAGPISSGASNNWELEEALDIEMAHAMAPLANIILYECTNNSYTNLFQAVTTAKNNAAVSVVSMSFGSSEFSGETSYDSNFITPASRLAASPKQGVTFIASTGDSGAPGEYPAYSPNIVAVGGTNLYLTTSDTYSSESAWGSTAGATGGGGGISTQEAKPAFQQTSAHGSVLTNSASRSIPDVSMVASNGTTVMTYDSYNGGYFDVYGTSVAAPLWSGLIADADGIRSAAGHGTLDGLSQTLPGLYSLSSSDFHDVTSGSNGFSAGPGYDLATGLGTPIANHLVPDLANYGVTANSTSYSLTVSGAAVKIHVATASSYATTSITGSIANTGTSGASSDSLTYGGFGLSASGGTLSGGTLPLGAGTLAASSGTYGSATFSSNTAGSFTIAASAASVANLTAGGSPALSSSASTTVAVYRLAAPYSLGSISLGNVHVGATAAQALSVTNVAANDGWSESLDASFSSVASGLTSGGSIGLLASGGSSAAMSLVMSTSTAGAKGGNVTISFVSDGNGTSGLGTTTIGSQTISVTGNVYSGQGVWNTNGGGSWGDFSKWTALGGVPGVDGALSAGDTALFGSALSAGSAAVSLNGASPHVSSLTFNSTASYTISQGSGGILNLDAGAGTASVIVASGNHAITTPVTLNSLAVFDPVAGSSLTVSGAIGEAGGSRALNQAGLGLLVLGGSNTYSGGTTISAGTLQVGGTGVLGTGPVTDNSALVFNLAGNPSYSGNISGLGTLTQAGTGSLTLVGNISLGSSCTISGGALNQPAGTTSIAKSLYVGYTPGSAGAYNLSGSGVLSAATDCVGYSGSGTFTQSGGTNTATSPLLLGGSGMYNLTGGALIVPGIQGSGGVFNLGGGTLVASAGFSASQAMTLTGGGGNGSVNTGAYPITLSGPLSGSGGLNKLGAGILTLQGNNSYSGGTTISAGALAAGASSALSPNSAMSISGGTLDATPYPQTIKSLTMTGGALNLYVGNLLTCTGTASFAGTLNLSNLGSLSSGTTELIAYGSSNGTFASWPVLPAGDTLIYAPTQLDIGPAYANPTYTLSATAAAHALIVGGSSSLTVALTNTGGTAADGINYSGLTATTATGGTISGLAGGGSVAFSSSATNTGLTFTSSTPGSYTILPVATVSGSNGTTPSLTSTGTDAVTVWDHSNASLSSTATQTTETINFGNVLKGATVPSQAFTIYNRAANTTAACTASLQLTGSTASGDIVLTTNLSNFGSLAAGSGTTCTASLNTSNYSTTGIKTVSMSAAQLTDASTLPGAGNNNNGGITVTLQGNVGNATADASDSPTSFGSPLTAPVAQNASYANLESTVKSTTGSGGQNMVGSTATILAGAASVSATASMAWRTGAFNPQTGAVEGFVSDVVDLSGLGVVDGQTKDGSVHTDTFVLQMTYSPLLVTERTGLSELVAAQAGLIQMDFLDMGPDGLAGTADDQWEPAVLGNFGSSNGYFVGVGSWNNNMTLGDWGVNTQTHTVWAVLDHEGQFAVTPEPSTLALLAAGAIGLAVYGWRRRKQKRSLSVAGNPTLSHDADADARDDGQAILSLPQRWAEAKRRAA